MHFDEVVRIDLWFFQHVCCFLSCCVIKSHESDENWICLDPRRIKIELFELKL